MIRSLIWTAVVASVAFVAGFAVSHFKLAHPVARAVLASVPSDDCLAEMVGGICTGGSRNATRPYENVILEQLPPLGPAGPGVTDFPAFLKRAVGWQNIPPSEIKCAAFAEAVDECFADYGDLLSARFLWHEGEADKPLVIVLHGHSGAADKVMGLAPEDYMRSFGKILADEGYGVAAPDLSHDANVSARLNGQLVLHGIQIYGLWSRLVCDIAHHAAGRDVVVYGLSNGGVIADHASVLCGAPNVSLVFVDDILTDWRQVLAGHPTIHAKQNYALHYLAPLRYRTTYLAFAADSRYPKIYTRSPSAVPASFPMGCLSEGRSGDWHLLLAPPVIDYHVAQVEMLHEVLETGELKAAREIDATCIDAERTPHSPVQ